MTDKSGQTRKSFLESMKGKAKEWTGALTGRDSLTAEGQLEQAGARRRRQASRLQAESDLEQRDAAGRSLGAQLRSDQEQLVADMRRTRVEGEVRAEQEARNVLDGIQAVLAEADMIMDDLVQGHRRGVDHPRGFGRARDHRRRHQGSGVETDRASSNQFAPAQCDQIRGPRPGADEPGQKTVEQDQR